MYPSSSGRLLQDMYRLDGKNWYVYRKYKAIYIFFKLLKRDQSTNTARQSRACVKIITKYKRPLMTSQLHRLWCFFAYVSLLKCFLEEQKTQ